MPSIERIGERLAQVMGELAAVQGDVHAAGQLLALLGWDLPPGADDIGLAALDVSQLAARVDDLTTVRSREDASDLEIVAAVAAVVDALVNAYDHVDALARSLEATPEYLSATRISDELFPRLADVVAIHAVGSFIPGGVEVGTLLGVFEFTELSADPSIFQVEHVRQVVRWDRFSPLLTDPSGVLREVYGWGTPEYDGNRLVTNFGHVLDWIAAEIAVQRLPPELEGQLAGRPVPEADAAPATKLLVSLDKGLGFDAFDVGLSLFALRATAPGGADGGIGLSPYASGTADASFPISDTLSLVPSSLVDLQGGLTLLLRAGNDPELRTGLFEPSGEGAPPASFGLGLRAAAPAGGRLTLFTGPGLSVDAAAVTAGLGVSAGADPNPTLTAGVVDGRVHLVPARSDGFLASILPADGVTATLDLAVSWSQRDGVRIQGRAGLRTTLALHQQVGPFRVDTLDLDLTATSDALDLAVTLTGATLLGPVTAQVNSVGVALALRAGRGNLGNADLAASAKPPTGVGLSIDSAAVTGGGFLSLDVDRGVYAGVVQLHLGGGIAVTGVGLITTQLPGGAPGFSLLVMISAEIPPLQLGLGFELVGVGGLLGVNRTVAVEALRAGLKSDALAGVLSPPDPVANAARVVAGLAGLFPPAAGRYVLGPTARIVWGSPTLITIDLCLVLEFPAPVRLVVLGRLRAEVPDEREAILRIQVDLMGVVDFDRREAAVDATLVDSHLAQFPLTGNMAMRLSWGAQPSFLLAAGGFHPRFVAPRQFPVLERVAVALASGDNPKLRLELYLALTSNTLQVGARVDLSARAGSFSIAGFLSFDALATRRPLAFTVDIAAKVAIKAGGTTLLSISLQLTLSGPEPWHVRGRASFSILFLDVTVGFEFTIGTAELLEALLPVDVAALVLEALADARAWSAPLPAGGAPLVTLRALDAETGVLAHPLGTLEVRQRVAPLDRTLERFGANVPSGAARFTITGASVGDADAATSNVRDLFAPGQFRALNDEQKLSLASFEAMPSGATIGASDVAHGTPVRVDLVYEQKLVTAAGVPEPEPERSALAGDVLTALLGGAPVHASVFAMRGTP
jgi:hypothetical protein